MKKPSSADLETYLDHLRGVPFVREITVATPPRGTSSGIDGCLVIKTTRGSSKLNFSLRRSHLRRENAESLIQQSQSTPDLLVMAPQIGAELGRALEKAKINYVDLAGNWYINLDDRYIAHTVGRTLERPKGKDKGLRAPAYRAIFAMLVDANLINRPTREIAARAGGLSPQTVSDVRNGLVERGLILKAGDRLHWTPGRKREAFDLWLAGFVSPLWPSLFIATFRSQTQEPQALEQELSPVLNQIGEWRWGGGAAADRLTDYYRGETTLIYFRELPSRDSLKRLRLVPDSSGNVILACAPGPLAFSGPREDTVHPYLVYADLYRAWNERADDAANVLRQKHMRELEESR